MTFAPHAFGCCHKKAHEFDWSKLAVVQLLYTFYCQRRLLNSLNAHSNTESLSAEASHLPMTSVSSASQQRSLPMYALADILAIPKRGLNLVSSTRIICATTQPFSLKEIVNMISFIPAVKMRFITTELISLHSESRCCSKPWDCNMWAKSA